MRSARGLDTTAAAAAAAQCQQQQDITMHQRVAAVPVTSFKA